MQILRGRTGQAVPVAFQDTTSVIGGGKTGLVFNTSGLVCYYIRELQSAMTAVVLATGTVGTWGSGVFKEIDAVHAPGSYWFSLPNAAISASDASTWVEIVFSGASGAYCPPLRLDLVAFNPQDANMGLSISAAAIADAVWDEATAGHVTAGTFGGFFAGLVAAIFAYLAVSVTTAGSWAKYVYDTLASILTQTGLIGTTSLTMNAPQFNSLNYPLVAGRTYKNVYGNALQFVLANASIDLTDPDVSFSLNLSINGDPHTFAGTAVTSQTGYFEIEEADTEDWITVANTDGFKVYGEIVVYSLVAPTVTEAIDITPGWLRVVPGVNSS